MRTENRMLPEQPEIPKMTDRELLDKVNLAIDAILTTGQSYTIGSRTLTRANITELRHLRDHLSANIAAQENASQLIGGSYVAYFEGR